MYLYWIGGDSTNRPYLGVMAPLSPQGDVKYSWFRTNFTIPAGWRGDNLIINFGAVDYEATVFVNVSKR